MKPPDLFNLKERERITFQSKGNRVSLVTNFLNPICDRWNSTASPSLSLSFHEPEMILSNLNCVKQWKKHFTHWWKTSGKYYFKIVLCFSLSLILFPVIISSTRTRKGEKWRVEKRKKLARLISISFELTTE